MRSVRHATFERRDSHGARGLRPVSVRPDAGGSRPSAGMGRATVPGEGMLGMDRRLVRGEQSVRVRAISCATRIAASGLGSPLFYRGWRRSRTVEITRKGRSRLREALPFWEKAQATLRQKLGSRKWPVIMADLDDLIRAA